MRYLDSPDYTGIYCILPTWNVFSQILGTTKLVWKRHKQKQLIRRFLPTWVKFKAKLETGKPQRLHDIVWSDVKCTVTEHRKLAGSSLALLGSLWPLERQLLPSSWTLPSFLPATMYKYCVTRSNIYICTYTYIYIHCIQMHHKSYETCDVQTWIKVYAGNSHQAVMSKAQMN